MQQNDKKKRKAKVTPNFDFYMHHLLSKNVIKHMMLAGKKGNILMFHAVLSINYVV